MVGRTLLLRIVLGAMLLGLPCAATGAKLKKELKSLVPKSLLEGLENKDESADPADELKRRERKLANKLERQVELATDGEAEPVRKSPKRSADEFVDRELLQMREKLERGKEGFDPTASLQKIEDQFAKHYGQAMPAEARQSFVALLGEAGRAPSTARAHNLPANLVQPSSRGSANGVLPAWFAERDQDGDGQLGLYEWPRAERSQFIELDINGDGFLEQAEARR